jgi:hypothetical protein
MAIFSDLFGLGFFYGQILHAADRRLILSGSGKT